MSHLQRYRFSPRVFPLEGVPFDAGELFARLRPVCRGISLLDSAAGDPRRWSLLAFDPLPARLDESLEPPSVEALRGFVERLEAVAGDSVPGPFAGGFVGALSYDLGVEGEDLELPRDPWQQPLILGALYCDFLVVDHAASRVDLVLGDEPGDGRPSVVQRRETIEAHLQRSAPEPEAVIAGAIERDVSSAEHCARVSEIRERIAAGDFYQANLSHRSSCTVVGSAHDLYRQLRRVNAAPWAAFLEWDPSRQWGGALSSGALLSASPELLLEFLERGDDGARIARTRPIKGTAPRHSDPSLDRAAAESLLASEKDRSELAMIVDLERNDLGRVARAGGVRVPQFPKLESYATVHHLVADVIAELPAERDAFDVLGAIFPGGSITGAPKVASMRAIAELEREGRGFFTGSAGFIDTQGRALWNILIRTLVWRTAPGG
ncbi:MAG: anthranilate synthase component I family protein, partial [Planctomycetota bacterium]